MCPLLVRTNFESTKIDEPAAGDWIRHKVLRNKALGQGWSTHGSWGDVFTLFLPRYCIG